MDEKEPRQSQQELAETLDIDISGDTANVAAARLYDAVGPAIERGYKAQGATENQVEFAKSIGIDVSADSLRVAGARIADTLLARNRRQLEELNLKPGDRVQRTTRYTFDGKSVAYKQDYIVSSIGENCRIYFKGGNGAGAWPSQVEKLEPPRE